MSTQQRSTSAQQIMQRSGEVSAACEAHAMQPSRFQNSYQHRVIAADNLARFRAFLQQEERSRGTIEKYLRDVKNFATWLRDQNAAARLRDSTNRQQINDTAAPIYDVTPCDQPVLPQQSPHQSCEITKETAVQWKQALLQSGRAASTINSMIAAVNTFFKFMGWRDLHIKAIRLQKSFFRSSSRELTKAEYEKLVAAAYEKGDEQLALLMETICATGIRVSEVKYITREAIKIGKVQISLKGKLRTILIPQQLCRKLEKYVKRRSIVLKAADETCEIFQNSAGRRMDRRQIWAKMKALCRISGIDREKVFPHNLRHLFARCFYRASRDLSALANMLGHSSIETTRIYLISTEDIYAKKIARLGLVRQTK